MVSLYVDILLLCVDWTFILLILLLCCLFIHFTVESALTTLNDRTIMGNCARREEDVMSIRLTYNQFNHLCRQLLRLQLFCAASFV